MRYTKEKRKVIFMEKKEMKIWRKILIIILIIVVLFIIGTARKMIIIRRLQSKMEKYESADNYCVTIYEYQGTNLQINTTYKKNTKSLSKVKSLSENSNRTLVSYNDDKVSHVYFDVPGSKLAILDGNGLPGPIQIQNELETQNLWQFIVRAIKSSIKTEQCNGKECYKIQVGCFDILCFDNHENDVCYFDKDTGLKVREFNGTVGDGENKINVVLDYQYEFDIVKDEDLKEPDISEYTIQEN